MYSDFYKQLEALIREGSVKINEPMCKHTTFKIGGPADIFVTPGSEQELMEALALCKSEEVPFFVMGNGSNLLVGDKGIRGVVFQIYRTMDQISFEPLNEETVVVRAGSGVLLSRLAKKAAEYGLCGFEFAAGIPGTFGGAITMNAGAYGGEMKPLMAFAKVLTRDGQLLNLNQAELDMDYRTSVIKREGYIILEASIILRHGNKENIQKHISELMEQRKTKQPLELPSAGSTFKRPEGYFAGKLIQDAGLKGYRVGGAAVSEKHSGFVVNLGGATAADVVQLVKDVHEKVFEAFKVKIEPEIHMIGEFD